VSNLVVFSHLRWSLVRHRPQHLMSHLAEHHRVLFVEEPLHCDGEPRIECSVPHPGVRVLVPHTPVEAPGFHDEQLPVLRPLIEAYLHEHDVEECIAWLCTPMALPLIERLRARLVVYDCMGEFAAREGAAPQLSQRETALLDIADVVFAAGPSLYEVLQGLHPRVHYLPGAVDAAHFAPPAEGQVDPVAVALQRSIPRPRLGFFGAIDCRLDLALLDQLAVARPDWHVVTVGPVAELDARQLPRRANLHWLGLQPYGRLPHLMAGWDLCLMPFALNSATRYASPLETLEYLAGEKPVVSTAVPDVESMYGDLVKIAHSPQAFVEACAAYLAETPRRRSQRLARAVTTVSWSSWTQNARFVHGLLAEHTARAPRSAPVFSPRPASRPASVGTAGLKLMARSA
jgi:glycosyltransferase involved in cell wall biosynthesis